MGEPAQTEGGEAVTVILTGNKELTDARCWLLDAGLFVAQGSLEVNMQITISPSFGT